MGGTTSTTNTSQQQKVELPAWVDQASQENYQLAKGVSGRPLQQYEGQRVADPSTMTQQGYGLIQGNVGAADPLINKAAGAYDTAGSMYGKAAGVLDASSPLYGQAADIYRGTAGNLDIQPYLNPYTQEVENRAVGNANTALTQQLASNASQAQKAGAFGGSRFGVQQGVTQGEGIRNIGDLTAALRKAGIDFATTTALQDRSGKQAAASGLLSTAAGMGQQAAGYGNAGAGIGNTGAGYLNTAASRLGANQQDITNLMMGGQQDTAQRQKVIDAALGKFQEQWQYPTEQLNMRLAALGMSPYGKTTTGTGQQTTDTSPDWATLGLGALKTGGSLLGSGGLPALLALSDRNTKTDIKKLTDGDIPMYSYRYKGDPKSYPKIVGPMAQDIGKKYPSAIKKVGRYKTIDINNLMEVLS
jgi:hypothetical protein